ncbi:hypothetical protein G6F46_003771 [Rhizopus delemar]|uniref:Uncharacterized protein n=3 Tax=Rhizopus TaxID=4842 RepID=I1BKB5_RHIO9|nr:hypothetical protein RO3G_01349 [Rhizopus delemar RA 99-880]KAG1455426.1 hypothetical protein G6F55_007078 [Rhizopus delemar]KAG1541068.1 hypothetical protein G6F51_008129 [Rhizopus arrhizus]KAG1495014.1 hypothetical protein G6F54_007476 [Rhizopus delemar]KAG1516469.1 hypothetical protein G6F53_002137 [Rhizopus delemar]|eukprot:EIE76645.1 hypothetical protein RO3G_01349 [Rhizopus delemar RA 99-880]
MFKPKPLAQQRARFKSASKNEGLSFKDEVDSEESDDMHGKDMLLLAQFLSTTGPEECIKVNKRQSNGATRILNKLRKKPSTEKFNEAKPSVQSSHHYPLRDSGVYSDISEKEPFISVHEFQFPQPPVVSHRPAPVPPINIRTIPKAAIQRRSRQIQARAGPKSEDAKPCPHCCQPITTKERRVSCPPVLASGHKIENDPKSLLAIIQELKDHLAEEKACRLRLEKAVYQKELKVQLEQEKKAKRTTEYFDLSDRFTLIPK